MTTAREQLLPAHSDDPVLAPSAIAAPRFRIVGGIDAAFEQPGPLGAAFRSLPITDELNAGINTPTVGQTTSDGIARPPTHEDPLRFDCLPENEATKRINREYCVIRGTIYHISEQNELSAIPQEKFKVALAGRRATYVDGQGHSKTRPAWKAWLESNLRREYRGM